MNLIENKDAIIIEVYQQRLHLDKFPFMEMELTIKNISPVCLQQLAMHYEPMIDSSETINEPSEIIPYQRLLNFAGPNYK